ncbi:hypothetical protein WBG78_27415 [Chryseolinea sp. T2]|uniref:HTTM domain-containing protein n=1 Tax=Chryseolinea sp. T2 TaxID=3129255 RepID=UPI0030787313
MNVQQKVGAVVEAALRRPLQPLSTLVFYRALTAAVLLRVLLAWRSQAMIAGVHEFRIPDGRISGPLLWPARFAAHHPHAFFLAVVVFLLVHLFLRCNYITAILFSLLAFNLLIFTIPSGDGGDVLTFMLSLWAIFLIPAKSKSGLRPQTLLYNAARIGCMLQFVFLYAASGADKIKSNVWTTGKAFDYMRYAGGMLNPDFPSFLATPLWDFAFSWSAILLETLFGVLIWFRSCQPTLIFMAIAFHLGIWWMMDLGDFSRIMIVAVLIFIRDDQYAGMFRPALLSA